MPGFFKTRTSSFSFTLTLFPPALLFFDWTEHCCGPSSWEIKKNRIYLHWQDSFTKRVALNRSFGEELKKKKKKKKVYRFHPATSSSSSSSSIAIPAASIAGPDKRTVFQSDDVVTSVWFWWIFEYSGVFTYTGSPWPVIQNGGWHPSPPRWKPTGLWWIAAGWRVALIAKTGDLITSLNLNWFFCVVELRLWCISPDQVGEKINNQCYVNGLSFGTWMNWSYRSCPQLTLAIPSPLPLPAAPPSSQC